MKIYELKVLCEDISCARSAIDSYSGKEVADVYLDAAIDRHGNKIRMAVPSSVVVEALQTIEARLTLKLSEAGFALGEDGKITPKA